MTSITEAGKAGGIQPEPITAVYPEFPGKVAVVTGAARGMGARFTAALATRGVHVVGADIDEPGMLAAEEFGRLDFWINNAGVFPYAPAGEISAEQIRTTMAVNVDGVLFGAQTAMRRLEHGGVIVNMASGSAVRVRRGRAAYCSSKAAVAHLTEALAVEFGDKGIRVNAIAPGYIDTDMTLWLKEDPATLQHVLNVVPLHRLGSPEEVVGPLLFLLSDSARYITGHILAVDAGSRHV